MRNFSFPTIDILSSTDWAYWYLQKLSDVSNCWMLTLTIICDCVGEEEYEKSDTRIMRGGIDYWQGLNICWLSLPDKLFFLIHPKFNIIR